MNKVISRICRPSRHIGQNRYNKAGFLLVSALLSALLSSLATTGFAQTTGTGVSQADKDKAISRSLIAIDKGCVTAAVIVKNQLIEKQNNKFNLLSTLEDLKISQMAFIQKSTLTAYLVFIDSLEPAEVNPALMSSQYMLNCLSFVRH